MDIPYRPTSTSVFLKPFALEAHAKSYYDSPAGLANLYFDWVNTSLDSLRKNHFPDLQKKLEEDPNTTISFGGSSFHIKKEEELEEFKMNGPSDDWYKSFQRFNRGEIKVATQLLGNLCSKLSVQPSLIGRFPDKEKLNLILKANGDINRLYEAMTLAVDYKSLYRVDGCSSEFIKDCMDLNESLMNYAVQVKYSKSTDEFKRALQVAETEELLKEINLKEKRKNPSHKFVYLTFVCTTNYRFLLGREEADGFDFANQEEVEEYLDVVREYEVDEYAVEGERSLIYPRKLLVVKFGYYQDKFIEIDDRWMIGSGLSGAEEVKQQEKLKKSISFSSQFNSKRLDNPKGLDLEDSLNKARKFINKTYGPHEITHSELEESFNNLSEVSSLLGWKQDNPMNKYTQDEEEKGGFM